MLIEIGFCLIILLFYGVIIPIFGNQIYKQCSYNYRCSQYLSNSLILFNKMKVDLADNQWREFRNILPLLISVAIITIILHQIWRKLGYPSIIFHFLFGLCFIIIQHGWHCIIVFLIVFFNYLIGKYFKNSKYGFIFAWISGISVLLFKESYRLRYDDGFEFLQIFFDKRYGGMYQWNLPANFLVLRLISYNIDSYYAHHVNKKHNNSKIKIESNNNQDDISNISHSSDEYNFLSCFAYCLYPPLYVAGPIITFNSYLHYVKKRQEKENVLFYGLRWCFAYLLLETISSFFPFFAVIRSGIQNVLTPPQLAVLSYVLLKMMWLKFLIIWRFFRLWSLADGINPPENMLKCMSNNYSLSDFWKGWHSSFNLWIVRYMYLPMGGRVYQVWNVWPIFFFVAIWHDIEPKLLYWGILNSIFYVIEMIGRKIYNTSTLQRLPENILKLIEILSCTFYIVVLISVNLVGYAIGIGGVSSLYSRMNSKSGIITLIATVFFLSVGVCIMKYIEKRKL